MSIYAQHKKDARLRELRNACKRIYKEEMQKQGQHYIYVKDVLCRFDSLDYRKCQNWLATHRKLSKLTA